MNHRINRKLTLLLAAGIGTFVIYACYSIAPSAVRAKSAALTLDQDAQMFARRSSEWTALTSCRMIPVRDYPDLVISFSKCPRVNLSRRDVAPGFQIPVGMERRVDFWKKVYGNWNQKQWAIHLADYPEVVLEVVESQLDAGDRAQWRHVSATYRERKKMYKKVLLALDRKTRSSKMNLTPIEKQLETMMAHIADPKKYLKAAHGIRAQKGQRSYIRAGLPTAWKYLPHLEKEFVVRGLPKDLAKIAFVESSFNLLARSKVGASGVYQIMPATGKQYLKILDGIDERNDPIKAAKAAARLLAMNHRLLGTWPLAVTAYNHGVGSMKRAVRQTGTKKFPKIINRYQHKSFGFASKNFYSSFLAALSVVNNHRHYFGRISTPEVLSFRETKLKKTTHVKSIMRKYSLNSRKIRKLNPDLSYPFVRQNGLLPRSYVLKTPAVHH